MTTARVGRLESIGPNGRPHVVPICFGVSGTRVVSVIDQKPKRTGRCVASTTFLGTPTSSSVDHYDDDWSALWWVRISGRGRVVDGGATREEVIDLLERKYRQYREHRPTGPALVIDITQISSWQATNG